MNIKFLFFGIGICTMHLNAFAQYSFLVSGIIKDTATSESLAGASLIVKNTSAGTISDKLGKFEFNFSGKSDLAVLIVKYIGYQDKEIIIHGGISKLSIFLSRDIITQSEVIISDSGISQRLLRSPITMIRIDAKAISQLPNENFYAGLATLKGINILDNSLFYKSIHLRGFSFTYNEGDLQLLDGMDNLPPGQGFGIGNLDGAPDIDIDNIEIIPGAASAIYGANAFNGLINVSTKNPFQYPGLSVQLKNGVNFIDGKYHAPALFSDLQIRYAKMYKNRFAFKFTAAYARGTDWQMLDQTDYDANAADGSRGPNNPGRDIGNIYGDEIQQALPIGVNGSDVYVSRTGYSANDMLGTITSVYKLTPSVYYQTKNGTTFSYLLHYTLFNANFGFQTWNFRDFSVMYNKLEVKSKNFFIRLYTVKDHDSKSFDAQPLACDVNNKWKPDSIWFNDYEKAYNGLVQGVHDQDHLAARNYADIGRPQQGSTLFNQYYNEDRNTLSSEGGAGFADESSLTKLEAQYDFSKFFSVVNIIAGIDLGRRRLYSHGTLFMDYPPPSYIYNNNYSAYVQMQKEIFNKSLSLVASARYDKFDIFKATLTPRISAVWKLKKNNFVRLSFQTGSRVPDPFDEYQFWHFDKYYGVGGLPLANNAYHLHERSFDYNSTADFNNCVNAYVEQYGPDSLNSGVELYKNMLKSPALEYIQPEHITSYEIGYQSLLLKNKLHIDVNIFYSEYKKRITYLGVVLPAAGNPVNPDSLNAAATSIANDDMLIFYLPVNAKSKDFIYGLETGIEWNFFKKYSISGNFSWQKSEVTHEDGNEFNIRIVPLKSNLSISNPAIIKNIGFSINWRWTDAYGSFTDAQHRFITNHTHANSILDAQITRSFPEINCSLKFGASNLLNHYFNDLPQSASVGGIYYVSILYDSK